MPKKILIFQNTPLWEEHYAEGVELAVKHHKKGHDIYFVRCDGQLFGCPANTYRNPRKCTSCMQAASHANTAVIPFATVVKLQGFEHIAPPKNLLRQLELARSIEEIAAVSLDDVPLGRFVINEIAGNIKDAFFNIHEHKGRITELAISGYRLYMSLSHIVQRETPSFDMVYIWNGRRPSDGPAVFAAKINNIPYRTFICGPSLGTVSCYTGDAVHNLKHHRKAISQLKADSLNNAAIREDVQASGKHFYYNQRSKPSKHNGGNFNFTKHFKHTFQQTSRKPLVAIFTSSLWEKLGLEDFELTLYGNEHEGIARILDDLASNSLLDIVVRWHPNLHDVSGEERKSMIDVIREERPNTTHFLPGDHVNSYSIMSRASCVITFGSTIGVEATFDRKPSICLGPAAYDCLNVCYYPRNHEEVLSLLNDVRGLTPGDMHDALVYGNYELSRNSIAFQNVVRGKHGYYVGKKRIGVKKLAELPFLGKAWAGSQKVKKLLRG